MGEDLIVADIKERSGLKAGQAVALIAIAVLNILWLVCRAISFSGTIKFQTAAPIVMLAIAAIYALYGYKKPHGNHVRYLLLIYAVYMSAIVIVDQRQTWFPVYASAVNVATVILATYMAGRLDRYAQNLVISIAVVVLQAVHMYPFISRYLQGNTLSFVTFFKSVGPVSVWLAIAASYIVRFKPHKEAGLADKN